MNKREAIEKARKKVEHIDKHARHEEKILTALTWVNTFHWSSASIIDYITQGCRRGFAAKLVKKGFLVERETYLGYPWTPHKLLILSKQGRDFLSFIDPSTDIWVGKISTGHLFHDYLIQFYIAKHFHISTIQDMRINMKLYKTYDAAILTTENKAIGIEIELSKKKNHEISNMFYNISLDILSGEIDEVHIVYFRDEIKNLFSKHIINSLDFEENKYTFYKYERNYKGRYEKNKTKKVEIPGEKLNTKFIRLEEPLRLCEKKSELELILKPKQPQPEPEDYTIELDDESDTVEL